MSYTSRHGWLWALLGGVVLIALSFAGLVLLHWNGWGAWLK